MQRNEQRTRVFLSVAILILTGLTVFLWGRADRNQEALEKRCEWLEMWVNRVTVPLARYAKDHADHHPLPPEVQEAITSFIAAKHSW